MNCLTKIGRPPRSDVSSTELVTIRLTKAEKEKLENMSWIYEQSKSELVRFCLDVFSYI